MSRQWGIVGCLLLASAAVTVAAGPAGRISDVARGSGSIEFGADGHGRGYFDFDVSGGPAGASGRFLFAAEDHHAYPDIIVRVHTINQVEVSGKVVRINAEGHFQETPVVVIATATDNVGSEEPDTFTIETVPFTGADAEARFRAEGVVFQGDIEVGAVD